MPRDRRLASVFPAPEATYNRDNEAQFRAAVEHLLSSLQSSLNTANSLFFDIRDYGAIPNDSAATAAAIEGADADAQEFGGVVLIAGGVYRVEDDVTILSPLISVGGVLKIASGKTVTAEGSITNLNTGDWVDLSLGGSIVRGNTFWIENKLGVGSDMQVVGTGFFTRNSSWSSDNQGFVVTFSAAPVTGSGTVGMQFHRDFNNGAKPLGISYLQDEVETWSHGLDADTADEFPDFFIHDKDVGDVVRIRHSGQMVVGHGVGQPSDDDGILNINVTATTDNADDEHGNPVDVRTMLRFNQVQQDGIIDHIIEAQHNGTVLFGVDEDGRLGVGVDADADFGLKVKGNWASHLGVDSSAPTFDDMNNGSIVFYLDAGNLKVAVKDSGGGTGTIDLGAY